VTGLSIERLGAMVRGPAGSEVHIRVARENQPEPVDFTIKRAKITLPDVSWHMLPGTAIAHVAILEFGQPADEQLKDALREAQAQGAKGLILDVRGNPGGLKDQAVAVTSEFLAEGNVFIEQDADGHQTPVPVTAGGTALDIPVVVLIDTGTASSA